MTNGKKKTLDQLAIDLKNTHRQKHKQTFPKISFTSESTNLSNIGVSEWVGILYFMCRLVQKNNALLKGGNKEVGDVLYVFQMILCFYAWVNKDIFGLPMIMMNIWIVRINQLRK